LSGAPNLRRIATWIATLFAIPIAAPIATRFVTRFVTFPEPMLSNPAPRFCNQCGSAKVELRIPHGDDRERHVCADCGHIHYLNPKVIVGTLPVWQDKVLLCKRAIEPRYGFWTLPAGFMEEGETLEQGAARETLEEAHARVSIEQLYVTLSVAKISQVYLLFRARLDDLDFSSGPESLEVKLFREDEIPWEEIAFRTIEQALRHYFADRKTGAFPPHVGDIGDPGRSPHSP
jgi:ADP-ribose pyrophosphatase YjhB (NUDIX family)